MYLSTAPPLLQIWRTPHPPERGSLLLCRRPLIHSGFMLTWQASGLGAQVGISSAAGHKDCTWPLLRGISLCLCMLDRLVQLASNERFNLPCLI